MEAITQNKKLLITILKALNPYRDLAEWFLVIVENIDDENIINGILTEIQNWIKFIKSKKEREKIKKEIKETYKKNDEKAEEDKEKADKFLNDFINNI